MPAPTPRCCRSTARWATGCTEIGLGKWLKAAMLDHLRRAHPDTIWISTENAGSNAPMLSINRALGYRLHRDRPGQVVEGGDARSPAPSAPRHDLDQHRECRLQRPDAVDQPRAGLPAAPRSAWASG